MAFTTTNLAELSLRNSHSLSTPPTLNPNLLFAALKRSFQLLRPLSSLKTPHYSNDRNPRSNRHAASSKTKLKHPSAPWFVKGPASAEPKVEERVIESNTEAQNKPIVKKDRGEGAIEIIVLRLQNLGLVSDGVEEDEELALEPVTGEEKLVDLLRRDWARPDSLLNSEEEEGTVLPWEKEDEKEEVVVGGGGGKGVKVKGKCIDFKKEKEKNRFN